MKTLYLECNMGAAGDMLTAALLELHPDPADFLARLNALGLPGVHAAREEAQKCGVRGTHMHVTVHGETEGAHEHGAHGHHHHHTGLHDIAHLLQHLPLPEAVRADVQAVYGLIAEAESIAHGCPVEQVHFHEVGTLDAVADVTAVCMLLDELRPARVLASPVHVGCGEVRCAHGVLPVPAPATALLLRGIPVYGGSVRGELCTPTGAALLRHFVSDFGPLPPMRVEKIGYGMGTRDFEAANCVRALLGETGGPEDEVFELSCTLDDMTPEAVAFAGEQLLAGGALDVYATPVQMKKNRPGVLLTCICHAAARDALVRLFFLHTSTLGLRETRCGRYTLRRETRTAHTPYGDVRVKRSEGYGVLREKPEYEDTARIARAHDLPLSEVLRTLDDHA